jgi:predicted nucleotide-binding protein
MALPRVFIASSSEGLHVAEVVRGLLLNELGDTAEIVPWTRQFGLSEVTIESLEKASSESDFAVLVLTPDDITTGRGKKTPAPLCCLRDATQVEASRRSAWSYGGGI